MDDAARIAQLEAENERLRERVTRLESRCGHLMVDADRREERALRQAESCEYHGEEIQRLRHMADWCWSNGNRQESARQSIVMVLFMLADKCEASESVPGAEVASWLRKAIDAQRKTGREPGFPTFADCQRAGGCDHPALSPSLSEAVRATRKPRRQSAVQVLFGDPPGFTPAQAQEG